MDNKFVITIGRQFGSCGKEIGQELAKRPVMEDGDASLSEYLRHLITHPHHIVAGVGSAVVAGPDHAVVSGGGVGLAAVGVEDQDLGAVLPQTDGKGLLQFRD